MKNTRLFSLLLCVLTLTVILLTQNGCNKDEEATSSSVPTGTVTDYDGNTYNTIQIGSQWWMAENLKTTHYANGKEITLVEDGIAWGTTEKAMCYYDNSSANADTYGALYNWAAAMNGAVSSTANPSGIQGACPDGWHLPSDGEWTELIDYLSNNGYSGTEGIALKSTIGWYDSGNGTDNFGFTALPGGLCGGDGEFEFLSLDARFWSATEVVDSGVRHCLLNFEYSDVERFNQEKNKGFSVRCAKDL